MDHGEFRGIEKAAGLKTARGYEISPVLAADGKVECSIRRPEGAVRSSHLTRWTQVEPGARRHVDDQGGLVAILRRWNPIDGFKRLHRIDRNLVGESLALLVGNGLSVH